MDGKTETEKVRVDIMENQLMDFRNGWVRLCYGDFEGGKADYIKKLPDTMKQFSECHKCYFLYWSIMGISIKINVLF